MTQEQGAPWDIYARQLLPLSYGYPLWDPKPDRHVDGLELGIVGYLEKGKFRSLFKTLQRVDGSIIDQLKFAPPDLELLPRRRINITPPLDAFEAGIVTSHSTRITRLGNRVDFEIAPLELISAGAEYHLEVFDSAGALLFLDCPAKKQIIKSKRHIVNYLRENIGRWHAYLETYGDDSIELGRKLEDLLFVSGTTKTTRWANAALRGNYKDRTGKICGGVDHVGDVRIDIEMSDGRHLTSSQINYGSSATPPTVDSNPTSPSQGILLPVTQCIFFYYFKAKQRHDLPQVTSAAWSHANSLARDDPVEARTRMPGADRHTVSDFMSTQEPTYDPVDILLDWILEHSEATMAIATDRDLIAIFYPEGIPGDVRAGLDHATPVVEVDEDGVGTVDVSLLGDKEHVTAGITQVAETFERIHLEGITGTGLDTEESLPVAGSSLQSENRRGAELTEEVVVGNPLVIQSHVEEPSKSHSGAVMSFAVSSDSKWIASGSEDGTIILWDTEDQSAVRKWQSHGDDVVCDLAFSPDSQRLLSAGMDGRMMIWDVEQGGNLATLEGHTEAIHSAVWSPDGTKIASASQDMTVRVWDTETYEQIHLLEGHNAIVTFVLFSSDGTMLASGGADYKCRIWNVDAGTVRYELQGHKGMVWSAAFDPECRRIATASDDGSVRIWSTSTGDVLVTLQQHHRPVSVVSFSADGKWIWMGTTVSWAQHPSLLTGSTLRLRQTTLCG